MESIVVPACKSGLPPLLNSRATLRVLPCIGSPTNALSVSIHLVSPDVTPRLANAAKSTFSRPLFYCHVAYQWDVAM